MAQLRPPSNWRERARSAVARIAARIVFGVESLAIATWLLLVITFFIVRSDWLDTTREWGSFLTHYALATPAARVPVNAVLIGAIAVMTLVVALLRAPWALRFWRALDAYHGARSPRGARRPSGGLHTLERPND